MIKIRVKELAEQRGMNMQALADKSGVAYSTVLDLWHDRVKRIDKKTLNKICVALEVQPGEVITREPDIRKPGPLTAAPATR
jgi:putative transcriptional regulator